MSDFNVTVVQIQGFGKHPNADSLSIAQVEGCPVIFRTGDFEVGSIAIYVPVDAMVPLDRPEFRFLEPDAKPGKKKRIRAKRLRGIFSMGMLIQVPDELREDVGSDPCLTVKTYPELGTDAAKQLGIEKYEEPEPLFMQTENVKDPGIAPTYGMESFRKYHSQFVEGEEVVITEKIHGCNARFLYKDGEFYVGSHRNFKKRDERNLWWKVAAQYDLEARLKIAVPGMVLYGEVYGRVQDLHYGAKTNEIFFAAFDIFDSNKGRFLDWEEILIGCMALGIPTVPVLYRGPYRTDLHHFAEGQSTLADNIKEGFVIRPVKERWNPYTHRTLFKLVSESYLLRKGGTEAH